MRNVNKALLLIAAIAPLGGCIFLEEPQVAKGADMEVVDMTTDTGDGVNEVLDMGSEDMPQDQGAPDLGTTDMPDLTVVDMGPACVNPQQLNVLFGEKNPPITVTGGDKIRIG